MKKFLMTAVLLAGMAVVAEAQSRGYGPSSGRPGSSYGYSSARKSSSYGYSSARYGYAGAYATGGSLYFGHGPLYYGAHPPFPRLYNYSGFGPYGGDFGYTPPYGIDEAYGYPAYRRAYGAAAFPPDASPAGSSGRGVADRTHELAVSREIDEGRRFLRAGKYAEALDKFRAALLVDTRSGAAQAWFALGLAAAGDEANADKALRAAAKAGKLGALSLSGLFKDVGEESKVLDRFGSETLVGAWLRFLKGNADPLRKLGENVPAARTLLKG